MFYNFKNMQAELLSFQNNMERQKQQQNRQVHSSTEETCFVYSVCLIFTLSPQNKIELIWLILRL